MTDRFREVADGPIGAHLARPDTRIEDADGWYRLVTPSATRSSLNEVVRARIPPRWLDAEVDRVIGEYRALGVPFKWVAGPDSDAPGLACALDERRLDVWDVWAMAARPEDVPSAAGIEVREVPPTGSYAEVQARGWEVPLDAMRADLACAGPAHRCFVATLDGEPVGAAASVHKARSAYLTGAVVLPEVRGRGVYRALLYTRAQAALTDGLTLLTTHARAHTSGPILARTGFDTVYPYRIFSG
ncbi:MAG: GNAT family N-acetyltransferase [Alphaproteobacteria bacterium]|nr:GNAT family N-acetyltransferase [Alphaproteobacteria bacterium]